jgi:hypothetical protein
MTESGLKREICNPEHYPRALGLMDEIRVWFRDPRSDFMNPYMIRLDQKLLICVELKPKDDASNFMPSLTVCIIPTVFHITTKGILKSAREEDEGVVLLPLYQGGGVEIQGRLAGMYNNQPLTSFRVPLNSDMLEVRRILKTLLQALA